MQLKKFQSKFKETMFKPASTLEGSVAEFDGVFQDSDIALDKRLKIYHNNVIGSISTSLCATFPIIENLVGDGFIKSMAREFIFENPPQVGCLQMYGAGFDDFIKTYEPAKDLAYLPDIATLEMALNNAYYARDDMPMAADALAQIAPEKLGDAVMKLRPSAALISSKYPLEAIRDFCLDEANNTAPDLTKAHKCFILISRPELEVNIISLEEDEFMALTLFNDGIALGRAVEATIEEFSDFDFTNFLQRHTELKTFSAFVENTLGDNKP